MVRTVGLGLLVLLLVGRVGYAVSEPELPCLDSSTECLAILTEGAISNSAEIEAINQRLALMAERIGYAESRHWTNYLTLDPLELVQNILGGGDVQRDRLAIADLELQVADLIRRREEVVADLAAEVVGLVLAYEEGERALELLTAQIETQQLQQAVMESSYRTGQGDTGAMLAVWQRTEALIVLQQQQRNTAWQTYQRLRRYCLGTDGFI